MLHSSPLRCSNLDELIEPLRVHLVPKLADELIIGILGGVSKRLEAAIRKVSVLQPRVAVSALSSNNSSYISGFCASPPSEQIHTVRRHQVCV